MLGCRGWVFQLVVRRGWFPAQKSPIWAGASLRFAPVDARVRGDRPGYPIRTPEGGCSAAPEPPFETAYSAVGAQVK
jgi:hypothetical protein